MRRQLLTSVPFAISSTTDEDDVGAMHLFSTYFNDLNHELTHQISIILTWLNQLCKCSCWNT